MIQHSCVAFYKLQTVLQIASFYIPPVAKSSTAASALESPELGMAAPQFASQDSHHIGIKSLLGRRNNKVGFSWAKGSTMSTLLQPCFKLVLGNFWELHLTGNCNLSSTYLTFLDATLNKQWKHGDENCRNTSLMSFCSPLFLFFPFTKSLIGGEMSYFTALDPVLLT